VTVSDGTNSCVGTVSAGQCTLTLPANGSYTLTATYAGDSNFALSASAAFTHQVCGAASVIITNTADNGAGSLRQGLTDVCSNGTITFSADFNTPQTITLTGGAILINKDLTLS
jgi:hypothetical protein